MYADNLGAVPTLQSLDGTNWKPTNSLSYTLLIDHFYGLAQQATDREAVAALSVLKDICTLVIARDGNLNDPLKPNYIIEGRRSAALEDFDDTGIIDFLAEAFDSLTGTSLLKARIGECLWHIRRQGRNIEHIRAAIDGYSHFPFENDQHWFFDKEPLIERAIRLSKSIGGGAQDRLSRLEDRLCSVLIVGELAHEPYWLANISTILLKENLGDVYHQTFSSSFDSWGRHCEQTSDFQRAQSYYDHSIRWLAINRQNDVNNQIALLADCHYRAGEHFRDTGELGLKLRAGAEFEKAIQHYRSLEREYKSLHNIGSKIDDAQTEIKRINTDAQLYMVSPVERPEGWRRLKRAAIARSESDSPVTALRGLSSIAANFNYDRNRAEEIRMFGDFPFSAMTEKVHLSQDGRVEARTRGIDALGNAYDENNEEHQEWIESQIFVSYQRNIEFYTGWMILPAYKRICRKHRIGERYFHAMVSQCTFIPHHRVRHFAKGLSIGFAGELSQSMHLLAIQLEGIVREHLQECVANTTYTADAERNITRESALGTMMDNHSDLCTNIYGKDLAYQIRHLFCNNAGPNIRNNIAHGLSSDYDDKSIYSLYAWCLCLSLVFLEFSIAERDTSLNG